MRACRDTDCPPLHSTTPSRYHNGPSRWSPHESCYMDVPSIDTLAAETGYISHGFRALGKPTPQLGVPSIRPTARSRASRPRTRRLCRFRVAVSRSRPRRAGRTVEARPQTWAIARGGHLYDIAVDAGEEKAADFNRVLVGGHERASGVHGPRGMDALSIPAKIRPDRPGDRPDQVRVQSYASFAMRGSQAPQP